MPSAMIQISAAQMGGATTYFAGSYEERLRRSLYAVDSGAPCFTSDEAWSAWWQETVTSGQVVGAIDTRSLGLHALLALVAGRDYLDLERLAWLRDLLTKEDRHEPNYAEIGTYFEKVAAVVDDVLHDRDLEVA